MKENEFEPLQAWAYDIEPLDVCILNELVAGSSPSTLYQTIKNNYGHDYSRNEINNRIESLKSRNFLIKVGERFFANPSRIYNHLLLSLIKLPLFRPYVGQFKGWKDAQIAIKQLIDDKFKELSILLIFTPEGERAYDICLFLCTNQMSKYYDFLEDAGKLGLIESSQTIKAHVPAGFYFNPGIVPSYEEFSRTTNFYKQKLPKMKE